MLPICSVYGLYSTEDRIVRYVGQTKQELLDRRTQHLAEALRPPGRTRAHRWIRKVLRTGYDIGIVLLEAECPWDEAEKKWIAEYRKNHPGTMTNFSSGGCGCSGKRSDATRAKMRGPKSAAHTIKLRKHMRWLHTSPDMAKSRSEKQRGNIRGRGEKNAQAVLTERLVIEIKEKLKKGTPLSVLARTYGMSKAAMSKIRTGRAWKYL